MPGLSPARPERLDGHSLGGPHCLSPETDLAARASSPFLCSSAACLAAAASASAWRFLHSGRARCGWE